METIEKELPFDRPSDSDKNVVFHIEALAKVYLSKKVWDEMTESDKAKTAFDCPLGFWEWNRMPKGITNAPSTFQCSME